jgi:hypothetical protein
MPPVTLPWKPNGEPIANTASPVASAPESPITATGSPLASILISATSLSRSRPSSRAGKRRPSASSTCTSSAPWTTWALVRTMPSAEMTMPEATSRPGSNTGRAAAAPANSSRGQSPPSQGSGRPEMRSVKTSTTEAVRLAMILAGSAARVAGAGVAAWAGSRASARAPASSKARTLMARALSPSGRRPPPPPDTGSRPGRA